MTDILHILKVNLHKYFIACNGKCWCGKYIGGKLSTEQAAELQLFFQKL